MITLVMTLGGAATAAAAGTTATTLTPNKVSAPSTASFSLTALSGFSGLPNSIDLVLQPGFTSSVKSVTTLCAASQSAANSCPSASQIGTGSVGISFFGSTISVPLTLFLGDPIKAGDIASVILSGSYAGTSLTVAGRLLVPAQGGLELLLSSFPSVPVTLESLVISAGASQSVTKTITKTVTRFVTRGKGRHKHRHKIKKKVKRKVTTVYALVTNPSTCTAGTWTGTATLTYASGTDSLPLSAACTP
jgi:hypothetical protein